MSLRAPATLLSFLLGSCVTSLRVERVAVPEDPAKPVAGHRYSLPAAFIMVTPDPLERGGYAVAPKLFPDLCETYAISGRTILGSHDLTVEVQEGLLDKVILNQSSAEVAAEGVRLAGELAKTDAAARDKEREAAEKAGEEEAAKLLELQQELAEAHRELALAQIDVRQSQELSDQHPDNIGLRQTLQKALLRLAAAAFDVRRAQEVLDAALGSSGGAPAPSAAAPARTWKTVKGPVFYRVVDNCDPWNLKADCKVALEAVEWREKRASGKAPCVEPFPPDPKAAIQRDFEVAAVPAAANPSAVNAPRLLQEQVTPDPVQYKNGVHLVSLQLTRSILRIDPGLSSLTKLGGGSLPLDRVGGISLAADKGAIHLEMPEGNLPAGPYQLELHFDWSKGEEEAKGRVLYAFVIP